MSLTRSFLWLMSLHLLLVYGSVRFTNLKCSTYDPPAITIAVCSLNVLRRNVVGMNILITDFQLPLKNITVNLSLHKKANGYRPFLYNVTGDMCRFMKRRTLYPLIKIFFDAMDRDSNFNHTCPFNHDIIVRNWVLREDDFRLLPLPTGEYVFKTKIFFHNRWVGEINGFFSVQDL